MMKNVLVRNSTAEFLTFIAEGKEEGIQVLYKNESIWATQKAMSMLFDCSSDNIGLHLKNIFKSGELEEGSVTEKISATAADGKMYMTKFYNLDAEKVNLQVVRNSSQYATGCLEKVYRLNAFCKKYRGDSFFYPLCN